MPMFNAKFVDIPQNLLENIKYRPGQIIYTRDTNNLFLDAFSAGEKNRIEITDVIFHETELDKDSIENPMSDKLYIIKESLNLYMYIKDEWVCLNKQVTSGTIKDADTVDGKHAYEFASNNHTHSYNDLNDKPEIFDGDYNNLKNKPTIPVIPTSLPANGGNADTVGDKTASDFAEKIHTHVINDISDILPFMENYSKNFSNKEHTHSYNDLNDKPEIFDGDYNNLKNKPTIPTITNDLTNELKVAYDNAVNNTHIHSNKDILDKISESNEGNIMYNGKEISSSNSSSIDLSNYYTKEESNNTFSNKEHIHSYNDLTNKPTIPVIPTSLPANGGNADTVGNKTVEEIINDSKFDPTTLDDKFNAKQDIIVNVTREEYNNLISSNQITDDTETLYNVIDDEYNQNDDTGLIYDSELSDTSINALQNQVITKKLKNIPTITDMNTAIENSLHSVDGFDSLLDTIVQKYINEYFSNNPIENEVELTENILTSNTSSLIYSVYTKDNSSSAYKIFDKNKSTGWAHDSNSLTYIGIDFATSVKINRISLVNYNLNSSNRCKDFRLTGSNDKTEWINIYEGTAQDTIDLQGFTVKCKAYYKYYRFEIRSNYRNGTVIDINSDNNSGLSELGLFGVRE